MQTRTLGTDKAALKVSSIGLGCMGMSEYYGRRDEQKALDTIHKALDLGVDFLDTADMYGPFTNEQLVGKAIQTIRDQVIIATKFGNERRSDGSWVGVNGRPDYVHKSCDASLKRLQVDVIDLYYQHRVDPNIPIEETIGAMKELIGQGKVRYLGLSEASAQTIRKANQIHPITALQSEYSLWSRDVEQDIIPTINELGIGFVPYSPLGRGFLSGKIKSIEDLDSDDYRRNSPRFQGENFNKNLDLVAKIEDLAKEKEVTPAQLALAWVMEQGENFVPIPGTKHTEYLKENLGSLQVEISQQDLQRIDEVAPNGAAAGDRYEDMSSINR